MNIQKIEKWLEKDINKKFIKVQVIDHSPSSGEIVFDETTVIDLNELIKAFPEFNFSLVYGKEVPHTSIIVGFSLEELRGNLK